MESDTHAPVAANGSVEVAASPVLVWRLMSQIEDWPTWNPDIKMARLDGRLEAGSRFTWKAGPGTIHSELTEVSPGSVIAWTGSMLDIRAHHVWRISETGAGTVVSTDETWSGLLPRLFPGSMTKSLQKAIDSGLVAIKAEAESRATVRTR